MNLNNTSKELCAIAVPKNVDNNRNKIALAIVTTTILIGFMILCAVRTIMYYNVVLSVKKSRVFPAAFMYILGANRTVITVRVQNVSKNAMKSYMVVRTTVFTY